jgi:hypothetical protein
MSATNGHPSVIDWLIESVVQAYDTRTPFIMLVKAGMLETQNQVNKIVLNKSH